MVDVVRVGFTGRGGLLCVRRPGEAFNGVSLGGAYNGGGVWWGFDFGWGFV